MKIANRYRTVDDLPKTLAVFPLRGCILLPRAVLSLQVFEPRYLAMLDAVIGGTRLIAIVQPDNETGSEESPRGSVDLRHVGCAGRVTSYQELEDGRLMIALTGVCRCEISAETTADTAFRTFTAGYDRFVDDLTADTGTIDLEALLATLAPYLTAHKLDADWQAIETATPESLINALAIMSPFAPEEKQALLEAANVTARAEVLCTLARMALAGGGRGAPTRLQ